jgi:DNA repair exonuclease SbcCD ATPase subunit
MRTWIQSFTNILNIVFEIVLDEADLAELRSQSVSNDLDPSQFFRNELAQAIREIRNDYENVVENQRNDMQNRYSLAYNELIIRQSQSNVNPLYNAQQRQQEERIRTELTKTQNQTGYLRAKNQEVKNRIDELQRKLGALRDEGGLQQAKTAKEIQEAKRRLDQAQRDFDEVSNLKTSLEKEITTYRDLLESKKQIVLFSKSFLCFPRSKWPSRIC